VSSFTPASEVFAVVCQNVVPANASGILIFRFHTEIKMDYYSHTLTDINFACAMVIIQIFKSSRSTFV